MYYNLELILKGKQKVFDDILSSTNILDVYRAITMKLGFHDQSWLKSQRKHANGPKYDPAVILIILF